MIAPIRSVRRDGENPKSSWQDTPCQHQSIHALVGYPLHRGSRRKLWVTYSGTRWLIPILPPIVRPMLQWIRMSVEGAETIPYRFASILPDIWKLSLVTSTYKRRSIARYSKEVYTAIYFNESPSNSKWRVENTLLFFFLLGAAAAHQHAIPVVASRIRPLNFINESHVERNGWEGIDCEACNLIGRARPIDNFAELFLITLTFVLGLMNFAVRR